MREEVARYNVDPGEAAYVQMLHYDTDGLRVLLTQLIQSGTPEAALKPISDRYTETFREWRLAFDEITAKYNVQHFGKEYSAELDYASSTLRIFKGAA